MDKSNNNNNNNNTTQRETHDFMNVESFSQLPFIRPTSLKEKGGGGGGGIRLFGKEFGGGTDEDSASDTNGCGPAGAGDNINSDTSSKDNNNEGNSAGAAAGGESSRRFECHYCCRNFPTSQALGGHQNAHKRERQHAKRAHLQSAMAHGGGGPIAGASAGSHVYGLLNYHHRLGAAYPAWNAGSGRFYGGSPSTAYSQPPINGSPLALWRIPPAVQTGAHPVSGGGRGSIHAGGPLLPLFAGEEMKAPAAQVFNGGGAQRGFVYHHDSKSAAVQDHVSLDLHL